MLERKHSGSGAERFSIPGAARHARHDSLLAGITSVDRVQTPESPNGGKRLDIHNPLHVQEAAERIAAGEPMFSVFANIIGVFGNPSEKVVGDINEFKGRPRNQTGSVTTVRGHYEELADWGQMHKDVLSKGTAMRLVDKLSTFGPVGFLLPAADHIPPHLSRLEQKAEKEFKTVQLIVPGMNCPSNALFAETIKRIPENYAFATSGNMSKAVMRTEQPAHYRYQPLVEEFAEQGKGNITVITYNDERAMRRMFPYHDQRSTTIVRLDDVIRTPDGSPVLDEQGRMMLRVNRHGSMNELLMRRLLAEEGYGVQFPDAAQRVPIRFYTEGARRMQTFHEMTRDARVLFTARS